MIFYAGIGARDCPSFAIRRAGELGARLAEEGLTVRSGHADGMDMAFEAGCDKANGKKEIYLPWKGFNGSNSELFTVDQKAYDIAKEFHPNWGVLSHGGKKLIARNTYQILGKDLDEITKSNFVVCWTLNAGVVGGTGQALRIAKSFDIPVFNLADPLMTIENILNEVLT